MRSSLVLRLAAFCLHAIALAAPAPSPPIVDVVYQFPNGSWCENAAFLKDGTFVFGLLTEPTLYRLDVDKPAPTPVPVIRFPGRTAVNGIVQTGSETLAVVAGVASPDTLTSTSHWAVFLVDLPKNKPAAIRRTFEFPTAPYLNGMTGVPGAPDILLIAGSRDGAVWRLDLRTGQGTAGPAFTDPLFALTNPQAAPVAINGVYARDGRLFFTNSNQGLYGSIAITPQGRRAGPPARVLANTSNPDDFDIAPDGTAYIAAIVDSEVRRLGPGGAGSVTVVAGGPGDPKLDHPTSVVVRPASESYRGQRTELYVTTAGAWAFLGGGSGGGQISRIRL